MTIAAGRMSTTTRVSRARVLGAAAALSGVLVGVALPACAGTLTGHVRFAGTPPPRPTFTMTADPFCDRHFPSGRPSEVVLVDAAGGLANVIVYVQSGLPKDYQPAPAATVASLDQKGCMFVPHVLAVQVGQEVDMHNSDETLHNVNARSTANTPFNDAMVGGDAMDRKSFTQPEVAVKLKCDIHPWMSAYIGVFPHPFFAVSGADGKFSISGVPEGDYTIHAWHESLGWHAAKVEIDDDEPATVDFSFAGN